jgi:anti-anti-sigma factor
MGQPDNSMQVDSTATPGDTHVTETGNNGSLTVQTEPGGAIVVHGDIDVAGGPVLDAAIAACESSDAVVVDLADVFFIDSSGLRGLLAASRRAEERGTVVILRAVGAEVARLLQITGTTDRFTIESTRG